MKKTTIQVLSIILAMGMISSCNNLNSKSDTAKTTEPVEMVTAEIPKNSEETEPQEVERASFKGGDGVETVTDKELIYNVKAIIDDLLTNGTIVDENDVLIPSGGFQQSITYVDNEETVKIQLNMRLSPNSEYNVDGNEVIKINAKYYVVPEDSYNELMSLYRQGRATENDSEDTEAEPQEIERASFKGNDGVETVTDKELIYNVKDIIDNVLENETIVEEIDVAIPNGLNVENSITYVDNGETVRIQLNMELSLNSEYYVDGNEVIKINSKYYVVPVNPYIELMSLYKQGRATENENEDERCRLGFINGDEVTEISDKEITSRIESISTILFSDLIEAERYYIDIEQTENTVPQGIQFSYSDGMTKRIEWNFCTSSTDKYDDKVILRETHLYDHDYDDSVTYWVAWPEQYDMLLELYNTAVSQ